MTFTVNAEKKRDWNKGWWRDSVRGRVVLGAGVAFALLLVPASVCTVRAWTGFDPASLDTPASEALAAALWLAAALFCACMAISMFWVVFVRTRHLPERITSGEALTIEGEFLTISYHRRLDRRPTGMDVAVAWLPGCWWVWDRAVRRLCLVARPGQEGAVRDWHYDDPSRQPRVSWDDMRPTKFIAFFPYFDPDVTQELRRLGVPEVSMEEARRALCEAGAKRA